jgi:hypothetical protein
MRPTNLFYFEELGCMFLQNTGIYVPNIQQNIPGDSNFNNHYCESIISEYLCTSVKTGKFTLQMHQSR